METIDGFCDSTRFVASLCSLSLTDTWHVVLLQSMEINKKLPLELALSYLPDSQSMFEIHDSLAES